MIMGHFQGVGEAIVSVIKETVIEVVQIVTPIITTVALAMVIVGLILISLRQEFYGLRLLIGAAIALIIVHFVVPVILGFL